MDRTALYHDMMERTQGDIYLGVIGPVRTGKSTFIKRFAKAAMPYLAESIAYAFSPGTIAQSDWTPN